MGILEVPGVRQRVAATDLRAAAIRTLWLGGAAADALAEPTQRHDDGGQHGDAPAHQHDDAGPVLGWVVHHGGEEGAEARDQAQEVGAGERAVHDLAFVGGVQRAHHHEQQRQQRKHDSDCHLPPAEHRDGEQHADLDDEGGEAGGVGSDGIAGEDAQECAVAGAPHPVPVPPHEHVADVAGQR